MHNLDWPSLRKTFLQTLAGMSVLSALLSFWLWGAPGTLLTLCAVLFLLLGLGITEGLTGVFTRTKTYSPTIVIFLFTGKFLWWGALFVFSQKVPAGLELSVALGMGTFLLALVLTALSHAYLPKNAA